MSIVDGDQLRAVLQEVKDHFGSQYAAAEAIGISQPSFHKLLKGKSAKRIRATTFFRLREVARRNLGDPIRDEHRLTSSVLTSDGSLVLGTYKHWLHQSLRRLAQTVRPLWYTLQQHPSYRSRFTRFLQQVAGQDGLPSSQNLKDMRVRLAVYRVLEPLAGADQTWGVERSWEELHDAGRLDSFLRHGLERERILMQRERDLVRINRLRPPDDYFSELTADEVRELLPVEEGSRKKKKKKKGKKRR